MRMAASDDQGAVAEGCVLVEILSADALAFAGEAWFFSAVVSCLIRA